MLADGVGIRLLIPGLRRNTAPAVREDHIPEHFAPATPIGHLVETLGGLRSGMVPLFGEPYQPIEDGLGPLHSPLGTAQDHLVAPHDDLAIDELLDPPEYGITVPEDFQGPTWRDNELDFYLAVCFRVASLRSDLVSISL
jgi:hypothetical protein